MLGVVWFRLTLRCRDSYLAAITILSQIINLIACTCTKLARNSIAERSYLLSWSVRTLSHYAIVILYVDIVACFPREIATVIIQ